MAWVLIPVVLGVLHASGAVGFQFLERLEHLIYDVRLRATLPGTADDRIVIVDLDEASMQRVGQWPWGRDKMAAFSSELFKRQQIAVLGFDVVFAEADASSGLSRLRELAQGPLRDQPGFAKALAELAPALDFDARFAQALDTQNAVLGYYFTSDRDGQGRGTLPPPALTAQQMGGALLNATVWNGFGANIPLLAQAAPRRVSSTP